jgi:hypothetical protein
MGVARQERYPFCCEASKGPVGISNRRKTFDHQTH